MNLDPDSVGYQYILEDDKLQVKYFVVDHLENGDHIRRLVKKDLSEDDFIYESLEEVQEVLESILRNNLESYDCDNDILKLTIINKYSALVDGHVAYRFDNFYYHTQGIYDSPVYVLEYNNRYAVFKHPNIKNYGFIINEK